MTPKFSFRACKRFVACTGAWFALHVLLHSNVSSTQGFDFALERQDMSCSNPAHHELESVIIYIVIHVISVTLLLL